MLAEGLAEAFQLQAEFSRQLGSNLYAEVMNRCEEDLRAGGIIARVMDGWSGRPVADAVALRLAGAVHRLALQGDAPRLARFYQSCGGVPHFPDTWDAFCETVETHFAYVREALTRQVQTNEVSRCAALLGGFLYIGALAPNPLRLLEIGTSAGLNQNWNRYHYDRGGAHLWGDLNSPVQIESIWHGEPPRRASKIDVASCAGCDIAPLDVSDDQTSLLLQSFIWPDQVERLRTLRAAIEMAREHAPTVIKSSARRWLAEELKKPRPGTTTVIFHSAMWWYMDRDEREQVTRTIEEAGSRADSDAAIALLQLEVVDSPKPSLIARLWPGGEQIHLAVAHAHGGEVWWAPAA